MKKFEGINTREVWDFRLSRAAPLLYNKGKTWVVKIHCNKTGETLEEHDTGITATDDNYDTIAIAKCYEWLYSIRDKYSRDNIELRKPVVAMINAANTKSVEINGELTDAEKAGDVNLANQKRGEIQQHLEIANVAIKTATAEMTKQFEGAV